jgi:hypothetical protein
MNNLYLAFIVTTILVVPFVVLNRTKSTSHRTFLPENNVEGEFVCIDTTERLDLIYKTYSPDGKWSNFLEEGILVRDVTCDTYEQFSFCCYYKLDVPPIDK